MAHEGWVVDVSRLLRSSVGKTIYQLNSLECAEALDLLIKIQDAVMRAAFGLSGDTVQKLLRAKPIGGLRGILEKRGKHVRVYFKYEPRRIVILRIGSKETQARDIAELKRKP